MSSQKPLIIPWLKSKIGDPDYPGLTWVNPEKTQFRIPWKHGLRHDRSDLDFKIFEGWAIENGTYRPGIDDPKPPVWKRNLRSALNRKSEVQMIEDHSSESSDPHKVYQIICQSGRAGQEASEESQEPDDGISPTFDSPWLDQDPCNLFSLSRALDEMDQLTSPLPEPVEGYAAFPVQEHTPQENNPMEQYFLDNTLAGSYPVLSVQEPVPQAPDPMRELFPNNTLETQFEVEVYYRGRSVLKKTVQNPRGMRFTSNTAPWTRSDLEDVVLPEPSMIRDHVVVKMVNKLLQSLVPGLLLEVQGGTIGGIRQGKCKCFWTMTENPPRGDIKEVQKEEYTPMFTLQQFVSELIGFMQHSRKESPLYSIWLCLGEYWPDTHPKPWTKKLIMVKVTPVVFRLLHEMSYSTGASSLSSSEMNLQISDSLSSLNLLSALKELEERMEIDFGC